jgi:hypothetical protein
MGLNIDLSANTLAQMAHFGWGALIVLAVALATGSVTGILIGAGVMLFLAALKEAVIDPLTETPETQGSGVEDFFYWMAGIVAGLTYALCFR